MSIRSRIAAIAFSLFSTLYALTPSARAASAGAPTSPTLSAPDAIYKVHVEPMAIDTHNTSDTLAPYRGKVILIVNVASKCGFTPQYKGLEALYKKYEDQGLVLLGFPCNQFAGQEPGTEAEILQFCKANYDVTFPIYAKLDVNGPDRAPLYQLLTSKASPEPGDVKWNFEKFLIGRDGKILARFRSAVTPEDPKLVGAVEAALKAPAPAKE